MFFSRNRLSSFYLSIGIILSFDCTQWWIRSSLSMPSLLSNGNGSLCCCHSCGYTQPHIVWRLSWPIWGQSTGRYLTMLLTNHPTMAIAIVSITDATCYTISLDIVSQLALLWSHNFKNTAIRISLLFNSIYHCLLLILPF